MGSHHPIRKMVVPEPVAIPDKLYFRIGDVARLCQVAPYVLRFWETEFPQLKPNKSGTGQRLYRKKDVEIALRVKGLLYDQGYTIPGARQILQNETRPAETTDLGPRPVLVREPATFDRGSDLRLRAQLVDLRDEMQSIIALLTRPIGPQVTPEPKPKSTPKPRLVLETKPAPKPTLHLAQGDLFAPE